MTLLFCKLKFLKNFFFSNKSRLIILNDLTYFLKINQQNLALNFYFINFIWQRIISFYPLY